MCYGQYDNFLSNSIQGTLMNNTTSSTIDNPSIIWVRKHNDRVFEITDLYQLDDYEIGDFIPISKLVELLDQHVEINKEDNY